MIVGLVFVRVKQLGESDCNHAQARVRGFIWLRKEEKMSTKRVSSKTHTQAQLDDWANQHNPNNKAYKARIDNYAKQLKSKKTHSQIHDAQRRHKAQIWPDWAPDYPDYDD